jgi:hypothetical protein
VADLALIPGVTETEPDTEPVTVKLVRLLEDSKGRSQDALTDGIADLERAYSIESNNRVRSLIKDALDLLRNGSGDAETSRHREGVRS